MDGPTRDSFIGVIADQEPRSSFHLLCEILRELTDNGRNVTDVEDAIGPLLLKWMHNPILVAIRDGSCWGGSGSGGGRRYDSTCVAGVGDSSSAPENTFAPSSQPSGEWSWRMEDVLFKFLSLLENVLKFNSAYVDEDIKSGEKNSVEICFTTGCGFLDKTRVDFS